MPKNQKSRALNQTEYHKALEQISIVSIPIKRILNDLHIPEKRFWKAVSSSASNRTAYFRAQECRAAMDAANVDNLLTTAIEEAKTVDPKRAMAVVNAYKNQVDTIKWILSRHAPKQYGEKTGLEVSGSVSTVFRLPAKLPQGASLSGRASPGAAAVQDRATTGGIPEHSVNDKKLLSSVNAENT